MFSSSLFRQVLFILLGYGELALTQVRCTGDMCHFYPKMVEMTGCFQIITWGLGHRNLWHFPQISQWLANLMKEQRGNCFLLSCDVISM